MKYEVVYSLKAQGHLKGIYHYIADHAGRSIAHRYVSKIEETCNGLSDFPMRGKPRDDIRAGLRTTSHKRRVVIVYEIDRSRVIIHGVFYGGRDYEPEMRDDHAKRN